MTYERQIDQHDTSEHSLSPIWVLLVSCWSIHLSHFLTTLNPLTPVPPVTIHVPLLMLSPLTKTGIIYTQLLSCSSIHFSHFITKLKIHHLYLLINKFFIDQACLVKMAGKLASFLFCVFIGLDFILVYEHAKINLTNIQPSWLYTWPIIHTIG